MASLYHVTSAKSTAGYASTEHVNVNVELSTTISELGLELELELVLLDDSDTTGASEQHSTQHHQQLDQRFAGFRNLAYYMNLQYR